MATLKSTDAWKIKIYPDDHAPPHFHVLTADGQSLVDIATLQERQKGANKKALAAGAGVERTEPQDSTMNSKLRIAAVEPVPGQQQVRITWSDGSSHQVSLAEHIATFAALAPLQDAELFTQVQVGAWGFDLAWPGDIELAGTTLYRLALEQAGEAMPKGAFKEWMQRHGLSLSAAAEALHLTRRTITAYSSGPKPIPYHIGLACKGWEVMASEVREDNGRYQVTRRPAKVAADAKRKGAAGGDDSRPAS